jgi:hypothetical protein
MLDSPDDGVVNAYCSLLIETTSGVASLQPVRSAYQPPANSTFLSEQINH